MDTERNFSRKHNVFTLLRVSVYYRVTRVLVKRQLESRQRQLGKIAVVKVGAYIVSIDRKTTVYRLEAGEIAFFLETRIVMSITTRSHISLTCL